MSDIDTSEAESAAERISRRGGANDRPDVSVWMPSSIPSAYVKTLSTGTEEVLPNGPVQVQLTIGGIRFGGYFTEIEDQIEAAREALAFAKQRAVKLGAAVATEGYYAGMLIPNKETP